MLSKQLAPWAVKFKETAFTTPSKKTLYISYLGVHPNSQGKGLGSALLRLLVEKSENDGSLMTLCNYHLPNVSSPLPVCWLSPGGSRKGS